MNKMKKTLLAATATVVMSSAFASTASAASYEVRAGDTLWAIAQDYNTSVSSLQAANDISGSLIFPGQVIETNGNSSYSSEASSKRDTQVQSYSTASVVEEARKHLGDPYVWGGTTPGSFDCSGLIYYVLNQTGTDVPRTNAAGYYNMAEKISNPEPGDLVFFSGTYKPGISHMGIYIGDGKMIQAGGSGVKVSYVHSSYWDKYFTGYGKIQ